MVIGSLAVDKVAESIKRFGFKQPIVIDKDGVIVAGHTRVEAARSLGMKSVPVIVADDLSPEQVRAYRIADNRTTEFAKWDEVLLAEELSALDGTEQDPAWLEFKFKELEEILVQEIPTTAVQDTFWINVKGPLAHQAAMLKALQAKAEEIGQGLVQVELGTIDVG